MSDLHNHLETAAGRPEGRLDLGDLHVRAAARHQRRRRLQAIGMVGATAVIVLAVVVSLATQRPSTPVKVAGQPPATASSPTSGSIPAGAQPGWHKMADAPIAPRRDAVTAWTGSEVVVIGGSKTLAEPTCPMGSQLPRCDPSTPTNPGQWLRDGAAYLPAVDSWHRIAPLPDGFVTSQTAATPLSPVAVLDGKVYVLGWTESSPTRSLLASYDPSTNAWSMLPFGVSKSSWWALTTYRDRLVVYAPLQSTKTPSAIHDRVYDPETGSWSDLPIDSISEAARLTPGNIRQMVELDNKLYDFASAVTQASSDGGQVMQVAVYDGHDWQKFSDPRGHVSYGVWTATGDHLTMVNLDHLYEACSGGSPGGPPALTFDPSSHTFGTPPPYPATAGQDLDFCQGAGGQGVVVGNGLSVAVASQAGALILDPKGDTWDMAKGPGDTKLEGFSLVWAGDQLFRWGGGTIDASSGTPQLVLSNQGRIWTPPINGSGASSTTSSVAPTTVAAPATTGEPHSTP